MLIEFKDCCHIIEAIHGRGIKKAFHVGAHLGEEAVSYAASGVEKVCWFEANQDLIGPLSEQLKTSNINHFIVPFGLHDTNTTLQLNITNGLQSSSFYELGTHAEHYPMIAVTERREMQVFRLDSLMDANPPVLPWVDFDFLNIDTQGAELAVLKGLGHHLADVQLCGIYLEVNSEPLYEGIPLIGEIDAYLEAYGFVRVMTAWTNAGWGDALYVRRVERA
jgi:FkbM family methyltransferase